MISETNLKLVRNITIYLYILRVILFQWDIIKHKYVYSSNRLRFTLVHAISAICHIILPLTYLINCGINTHERSCSKMYLKTCLFAITWQSLMIIELICLIQDDAEQVVIAHKWMENFVAKIKRKLNFKKRSFKK